MATDIFGNEIVEGKLSFGQILAVISERFPQYVPILSKPGVWDVLQQAFSGDPPWSSDRIFAALQNTEYFRTTTDTQRQFDALVATNPATAHEVVTETDRLVKQAAFNLGIVLDPTDQLLLTLNAAQHGWDSNRIMAEAIALVGNQQGSPQQHPGLIAAKMTELEGIGAQFGITLDPQTLWWGAANIAAGVHSQEQMVEQIRQQSMALFPALRPYLETGGTVAQYAQPYFAMAQQELGINPNQIDLRNPAWQDLFLAKDDKGAQGVRSMSEALSTVRTDPRYGYDQGLPGRTQAASFGQRLLQEFGAMG